MLDLARLITDADLRRRFGTPTVERGRDYAERGLVVSVDVRSDGQGEWILHGRVAGKAASPYDVVVDIGDASVGLWMSGSCTCPMVADCKHVVAVVLSVRDQQGSGAASRESRWEWSLDGILDELEGREQSAQEPRSLGLQLDLSAPVARGYREWSGAERHRGALRLRPVRRSKRRAWVKAQISWQGLDRLPAEGFRADQVAVLEEMLAGYRANARMTYYGSEEHLQVASFGPLLWSQLERARAAGVELVAGPGLSAVAVVDQPVRLQLDANTSSAGDVSLGLGVMHETEWYSTAQLEILGTTGHGVALYQDGDHDHAVILAPLERAAGPQVRRLAAARETVVDLRAPGAT